MNFLKNLFGGESKPKIDAGTWAAKCLMLATTEAIGSPMEPDDAKEMVLIFFPDIQKSNLDEINNFCKEQNRLSQNQKAGWDKIWNNFALELKDCSTEEYKILWRKIIQNMFKLKMMDELESFAQNYVYRCAQFQTTLNFDRSSNFYNEILKIGEEEAINSGYAEYHAEYVKQFEKTDEEILLEEWFEKQAESEFHIDFDEFVRQRNKGEN